MVAMITPVARATGNNLRLRFRNWIARTENRVCIGWFGESKSQPHCTVFVFFSLQKTIYLDSLSARTNLHTKFERLKSEGIIVKIALASQNKKSITGHTGHCQNFWIYESNGTEIIDKKLL